MLEGTFYVSNDLITNTINESKVNVTLYLSRDSLFKTSILRILHMNRNTLLLFESMAYGHFKTFYLPRSLNRTFFEPMLKFLQMTLHTNVSFLICYFFNFDII